MSKKLSNVEKKNQELTKEVEQLKNEVLALTQVKDEYRKTLSQKNIEIQKSKSESDQSALKLQATHQHVEAL